MKQIRLSTAGGDRATGYVMSNKIVPTPEGLLCTWIDAQRVNQWAIVDPTTGRIVREGTIGGQRVDNHCGAAFAVQADGTVNAIIGAHHASLDHFVFHPVRDKAWRHLHTLDIPGTYPSLVCDGRDVLHLVCRCQGDRWWLGYSRYEGEGWSDPRALVRAHKEGYIY